MVTAPAATSPSSPFPARATSDAPLTREVLPGVATEIDHFDHRPVAGGRRAPGSVSARPRPACQAPALAVLRLATDLCDGSRQRLHALYEVAPGTLTCGLVSMGCAGTAAGAAAVMAVALAVLGAAVVFWPLLPLGLVAAGLAGLCFMTLVYATVLALGLGSVAVAVPLRALRTGHGLPAAA